MKKNNQFAAFGLVGFVVAACLAGCSGMGQSAGDKANKGTISETDFGKTLDGTPVELYTLRNSKGMEARIMTYGGIVQSLKVPDKNGQFGDVVLGYDSIDGYLTNSPFFGALIG